MRISLEYTSFVILMPSRNYKSEVYPSGFNGKENDNEIKGVGNQQDYGMRSYDTRIGRPISIDPLADKYPDLSTYQFFSNSPILNIDLDGLEGIPAQLKKDNSGYTTAIDVLYKPESPNPYRGFNYSGTIKSFEPNIFEKIDNKLSSSSSGVCEAVGKFAGKLVFDVINDATIIGTSIFYGKTNAFDLKSAGVNNPEFLDAGINTITNLFPIDNLATKAFGELKSVGFSEMMNNAKGTEFAKSATFDQKNSELWKFNHSVNTIIESGKTQSKIESVINISTGTKENNNK